MAAAVERARGKIGDDGIERVTTQMLFDMLGVPQRRRGAGACRRLAKLMAEIGWTAVRVRGSRAAAIPAGWWLCPRRSVPVQNAELKNYFRRTRALVPAASRGAVGARTT